MAYESDPHVLSLEKYFERDEEGPFIRAFSRRLKLHLDDDDMWTAREIARSRSGVTKALTLAVLFASFLIAFWWSGTMPSFATFAIFFGIAFVLALILNMLAAVVIISAIQRWKIAQIAWEIPQNNWKRRGIRAVWGDLAPNLRSNLKTLAAMLIGLAAWLSWSVWERDQLMTKGELANAEVFEWSTSERRCLTTLAFEWDGRAYALDEVGCDFQQAHPVGTSVAIRVDPQEPSHILVPENPRRKISLQIAAALICSICLIFLFLFSYALKRTPSEEEIRKLIGPA